MSMSLAVSVLVVDVNELLRTIWHYRCVSVCDETWLHTELKPNWNTLVLRLPPLNLSSWKTSDSTGSCVVNVCLVPLLICTVTAFLNI